MSIRTEEDIKDWSEEYIDEFCTWCFHHDYGFCERCAIEKRRKIAQAVPCPEQNGDNEWCDKESNT